MFDFLSQLTGKGLLGGSVAPKLMGLQQGTQAAGPGMSFGGVGGPTFGGFPGQPNVDPFRAQMGPQAPVPSVTSPQGAVTTPAGLEPTLRGGQPNFFPNVFDNLGLNESPNLSPQLENLPPFMRQNRERQQMQPLPSGGVHRMSPLAPQRFGQMAQLRRRGR